MLHKPSIILIAQHYWKKTFQEKAIYILLTVFCLLLLFSAYTGWMQYTTQNQIRIDHQEMARESWEANPDKHPHRMAHFGTFAFRLKHPLSLFDFGLENYMGNAVFLEAHAQNSINFSEASLSSDLIRFGELSLAMILQLVLPLIIFFLGYRSVVEEREKGTLLITHVQGVGYTNFLLGKSLGLWWMSLLFFLPAFLMLSFLFLLVDHSFTQENSWSLGMLFLAYLLYCGLVCLVAVLISARSYSSKQALVRLVGIWILMVVILPKSAQALGRYLHPAPNTFEFNAQVQEDIDRIGNSHRPDDPFFSRLRDSVLQVHQVNSITELPFNYGGFVMQVGEKLSSRIYNKHHHALLDIYRKQNSISQAVALLDPYAALKHLSMTLAKTDFESYVSFQQQAEDYRYQLAQTMNGLQMKYISSSRPSGSEGQVHVVSREHWKAFPDFNYQFPSQRASLQHSYPLWLALGAWSMLLLGGVFYYGGKPLNH